MLIRPFIHPIKPGYLYNLTEVEQFYQLNGGRMDVLCSCKSKNSNTKLQRQKRSRFSIDLWTHRVKLRAQMPHESKTSYDG